MQPNKFRQTWSMVPCVYWQGFTWVQGWDSSAEAPELFLQGARLELARYDRLAVHLAKMAVLFGESC